MRGEHPCNQQKEERAYSAHVGVIPPRLKGCQTGQPRECTQSPIANLEHHPLLQARHACGAAHFLGVTVLEAATIAKPAMKTARAPILFLVVSAFLVALISRVVAQSPQAGFQRFLLPDRQQSQALAISPDGTQLVYVANSRLYLKGSGEPQAIPGTEIPQGVASPVFSPDGRSIAFLSGVDQTLKRVSVTGGAPTSISSYRIGNLLGMNWASNDEILFAQVGPTRGVMRVAASGGTPEALITLSNSELALTPQVLPGNKGLMFSFSTLPQGPVSTIDILAKAQIVVQPLPSGERKLVLTGGYAARYVPTGHIVYMSGGTLMAVPFDLEKLEATGPPDLLLESVLTAGPIGTAQFSVSETGTLVYAPTPEYELASVDLQGAKRQIGSVPNNTFAPRVSLNGQQLTFDRSMGAESAVWLYELSGAARLRRFTQESESHYPIWSIDGERLIFISVRQGQPAIYWQRADGVGAPERLTETARAPESVSVQNQMLSFITLKTDAGAADYDVWTYSFRDKKAAPLIEIPSSAQHSSRFSPDGRWIAYVSDETGRLELYVQPFPTTGAKFQITKNGGGHPLWSPDGRQLYFDNAGRMFSVAVRTQPTFFTEDPVPLPIQGFVQGTGNNRRQYDLMPDGKQFIMMFPPNQEIRTVPEWFGDLKQRVRPK